MIPKTKPAVPNPLFAGFFRLKIENTIAKIPNTKLSPETQQQQTAMIPSTKEATAIPFLSVPPGVIPF